jgi:hypothetical protein
MREDVKLFSHTMSPFLILLIIHPSDEWSIHFILLSSSGSNSIRNLILLLFLFFLWRCIGMKILSRMSYVIQQTSIYPYDEWCTHHSILLNVWKIRLFFWIKFLMEFDIFQQTYVCPLILSSVISYSYYCYCFFGSNSHKGIWFSLLIILIFLILIIQIHMMILIWPEYTLIANT